jgi:ABC-type enterochelin transport system substrate-binding protein
MGIAIGTTITVTFDAQQISQLDCLLQNVEQLSEIFERADQAENTRNRVNNVFRALHAAGYR